MQFPVLRWLPLLPGKTPLRLVVAAPFVLQTLGTVALVGYFAHQSGQKAVERMVDQLMQEVGARVNLYLTDYVNSAQQVNQLNVNSVRLGQIRLSDPKNLERHFRQQIQTFDSLNRIYFSNPEGGLISVGNDERGATVASTENFKRGTLRVYSVDDQGKRTKILNERQNYDATQRPFYTQAVAAGKPTWTPIFTYVPASAGLGIAASYPLYDQAGRIQGVLSSDLTLAGIQQFLKQVKVGNHGTVFIIERSGRLIAAGTSAPSSLANSPTELRATESEEPLIRQTVQYLSSRLDLATIDTATQLQFTAAGGRQFLKVIPFQDQFGLDWLTVTVVPEADFMAEIYRNAGITTLLCGTTLLLSIGLSVLLSRWLTRPILRLNAAAKTIAQGNLDTEIAINRSDELGELAQSFDQMILQLKAAFAGLRELNQAVMENEAQMRQILETLPVGVSMHRPDGTILYLNSSGKQILGITDISEATAEELAITHSLYHSNAHSNNHNNAHDNDCGNIRRNAVPYLDSNLPIVRSLPSETISVDEIDLHRNGKAISLEVHSTPVFDQQGTVVASLTVFQDITQRKAAAKILADYNQQLEMQVTERTQALRQSEALNRAIRDALPDLLIRMRSDGTYLDVKYPTNFSLINADVTVPGNNVRDSLPPEAAEQRLAAAQQALQTGTVQIYEFSGSTQQQTRWFEVRVVPLTQDEVLVVIRDITERKQAEDALKQSEEKFQEIAAVSPVSIYIFACDADGSRTRFEFVSSAIREIHELEPERVLKDATLTHNQIHPEDRAAYHEAARRSLYNLTPFSHEWRIITPSGRVKWVQANSRPVRRKNGEIVWYGVMVDITDRKQAEAALQDSREQFRNLVEQTSDWIWEIDAAGHFTYVSPQVSKIIGYLPQEVLGLTTFDLMPKAEQQRFEFVLNSLMSRAEPFVGLEKTLVCKNGKFVILETSGSPIFDTSGHLQGYRGIARDITARKQAELELRRQKDLRETIYNESTDALFLVDPESLSIIDCNQRAVELFEAEQKAELIGLEGRMLQHRTFTDAEVDQIVAQMKRQGEWSSEIEYVTRKGKVFWGSLAAKIVQIANQSLHLVRVTDITARKQTEAALRRSEERNRAILTAIPDLMTIMSADGTYLDIVRSKTLVDLIPTDVSPVGKHISEFLPSDIAARKLQAIERALTTRDIQVYEQQVYVGDKIQYEEVRVVPYGENTALLMLRDITARKQAEEALRQSEAMQRQILKAMPDLLIWMDQNGVQLQKICGKATKDVMEETDATGQSVYEILPLELAQKRIEMIRRALRTGEVQIYEQELVIEGKTHYEEVRIVAVEADRVLVIVRDITDRKQAEQQLRASLQREQAIARVIDRMHRKLDLHSIFETTVQELRQAMNGDRLVIYRFNPNWSGNCVAESVASGWVAVMQAQTGQQLPDTIENDRCLVRTWNETTTLIQDTYLQETEGGTYRHGTSYVCVEDVYKANFSPCYLELLEQFQARAYVIVPIHLNSQLWGLLAVYQNSGPREWQETEIQIMIQVSQQLGVAVQQAQLLEQTQQQAIELLSAKEAAESANRAKSNFLANMSHELRTPLNAILGFAQLIGRDASTTPEQQDYLTTINRNGEYLLQLINDVLSISKIEAGRVMLQKSNFDLYALLDTLEGMFRLRAETNGLQLICERSAILPQYIHADERKLRQIITNLLDNAIKFTPAGRVSLRVRMQDQHVEKIKDQEIEKNGSADLSAPSCGLIFEVSDTGVGIADKELTMIFEAFVQSEAGERSNQGTGLGLPISRRFAQMMGGDITVSSKLGKGSTFCFSMIATPVDAAAVGIGHSSRRVIGLAPNQPTYRILVVDDTDTSRHLMVRWLADAGFEVRQASNGQEAIEQWSKFAPHLIWMDMRMPTMDGFEAVRQIRSREHKLQQANHCADRPTPTKIIAITAAVFDEERQAMLAAGCDDFVGKPCPEEVIFDMLAQHLGVRYRHEDSQQLSACHLPEEQVNSKAVIQQGLAAMPAEWVARLNRAALIANDQVIFQLLEEIPESQIALKDALTQLVKNFQLDQLIQLIQLANV
jgi:PAS domain S-box-containing protein